MLLVSLVLWHIIHGQVILIQLDKINRPLPNILHNLPRNQLPNRIHKSPITIPTLRCLLTRPIIKSLSHRIIPHNRLHIMPELTEQLMIKTYRPILTQELYDIRDQTIIITLTYSIQILDR